MTAEPIALTPFDTDLSVEIEIDGPDWARALPDLEGTVRRALSAALAAAVAADGPVPLPAEVSVLLTDDARQRGLNAAYRGKDASTNVLSFPGFDPDDPLPPGMAATLGDISVAFETTTREAEAQGLPFRDHFTHLLVHGLLHLLGYDHEDENEAETMEALEVEILAGFGIADPYAEER